MVINSIWMIFTPLHMRNDTEITFAERRPSGLRIEAEEPLNNFLLEIVCGWVLEVWAWFKRLSNNSVGEVKTSHMYIYKKYIFKLV